MTPAAVEPLQGSDRADWERLARGYKAFYRTHHEPAVYDRAFARLVAGDGVHAFVARREARLVGIVHYLFHTTTWGGEACYLQDLYVDAAARGQGIAAALIEAVAGAAHAHGATRLYWLTHETNAPARALYDRVAQTKGFIRYDHPM